VIGDADRETTKPLPKLNTDNKDRRIVVTRRSKPEKERAQLSLLDSSEYKYSLIVTNTELPKGKVVISYEKHGSAEKYIKEA
jgi:hypothetical protein